MDTTDFTAGPSTTAGDRFIAGGANRYEQGCSCLDGFHYIGRMVEDESGAQVEVYSAYPCARYDGSEER